MDNWNHCKSMVRRRNPSFSSSLLDEICRSIDHQTATAAPEYRHKTGSKTDRNMDMLLYSKPIVRKKSASAEYYFQKSLGLNSCSTSSDSSFWTSSDSDTSKSLTQQQLSARKSFSSQQQQQKDQVHEIYVSQRKLKNECGGFVKAKSKTLKMYNDLKKSKAKQPLSPGSRLASFLNSLFTSPTNAKKSKTNDTKDKSSSACSSASRSCLSKTPSSQGKLSDGSKRSVRFYPVVSVIMDEDEDNERRRWKNNNTEKSLTMNSVCGEKVRDKNWHTREVLNKYQEKFKKCTTMMMDDDDEEDCESCASSDLFELDNLDTMIGSGQRYCEELPVYETTSVNANRAIAHGFIL